MKRYWEQLKPQERRWAVGIGAVVFLMLNYFFVWPHRHDWGRDQARMKSAQDTNQLYSEEIKKKNGYMGKLRDLQSEGQDVLPEDQAIDFIHFYSSREVNNKITPLGNGPLTTRTNEFFVEQQMGITCMADETNLVNFLYSLSEGNSMMRVRAMSLHPDPGKQQLNASLTLVASYQKKAPARSGTGSKPERPTGVASTAPVKPIVTAAKTPTLPAAQTPGTRPPNIPPRPAPFSPNPAASPDNSTDRSNRVAGAFARPNAPPKKSANTAQ